MMTNDTILSTVRRLALVTSMFTAMTTVAAAQLLLTDVGVRLVRSGGDGCAAPCTQDYTVMIRGDGTVEYEGSGAVAGFRTRSVSPDEVIALVNEFLRAGFFNALDTYSACCSPIVRKGNTVELYGMAPGSGGSVAVLTLRIGTRSKTVTLGQDYPPDLGRLPELVDRIGGPRVWQ
jgi:hypothetical protein